MAEGTTHVALSLEGHLFQPTLPMLEAGLVLQEPSLAEVLPTIGEVTEVWDRSTELALDPKMVQKSTTGREGIHVTACYHHPVAPRRLSRQFGYDPFRLGGFDLGQGCQGLPKIRSRSVAMETPYRSSIDPDAWNARFKRFDYRCH